MPATKKPAPKAKQEIIGTRVKITLDDSRGKETLTLETPAGQKITLSDARGTIEIADGNGNTVRLEPGGITIQTAAKVTINAAELKVRASAVVVDAAMSKFNGNVQCDTLISNAVVSASYTPGAGNIL